MSASITNLCGLENPPRAQHCFLNCVVQLLWHCRAFRAKLLEADPGGHTCLEPYCFVCLLRDLFLEYATAPPPTSRLRACTASVLPLRLALHDVTGGGIGLGETADASEALMVVLQEVHNAHSSQRAHAEAVAKKAAQEEQERNKRETAGSVKAATNIEGRNGAPLATKPIVVAGDGSEGDVLDLTHGSADAAALAHTHGAHEGGGDFGDEEKGVEAGAVAVEAAATDDGNPGETVGAGEGPVSVPAAAPTQRIVRPPVPPPPSENQCPQYSCLAHATFFCYFCDQIQCECGARSDPAIYDTHFGLSVYVSHVLEYRHPKVPPGYDGEPMYFERVLGYAVGRSLDPVGAVGPSKGSVVDEPETPKPNRYGLVIVDGAVTEWWCERCTFRNVPRHILCQGCQALRPARITRRDGRYVDFDKWIRAVPQRSGDARDEPSAGTPPPTHTQPPGEAPAAVLEAPPPRFECGTAACPGTTFSLRRYLLNTPQVFNLNFVFTPEDTKSSRRLGELLNRIGDPVDLEVVFDERGAEAAADQHIADNRARGAAPAPKRTREYWMRGIVCYSHRHYVSFYFYPKYRCWVQYNDSHVTKMADWPTVKACCVRNRYLPVMVFYELGDGFDDDQTARQVFAQQHTVASATWKRNVTPRILPVRDVKADDSKASSQGSGRAVSGGDEHSAEPTRLPPPAYHDVMVDAASPGNGSATGAVAGAVGAVGAGSGAGVGAGAGSGNPPSAHPPSPGDSSERQTPTGASGTADSAEVDPQRPGSPVSEADRLRADMELAKKLQEEFDKEDEELLAQQRPTTRGATSGVCRLCRQHGLTGRSTNSGRCVICSAPLTSTPRRSTPPSSRGVTRHADRWQTTSRSAYSAPSSRVRTAGFGSTTSVPRLPGSAGTARHVSVASTTRCAFCQSTVPTSSFMRHRQTCVGRHDTSIRGSAPSSRPDWR